MTNISAKEGTSLPSVSTTDPVSDDLLRIFQWILFTVLCQVVDVFGSVANVINIICFVKQGFNDSVNVSLLGLAISDFGCLATLIFANICFTPSFQSSDLPFDSIELQFLVSSWPHLMFTRVTSWITAFITLERCLCIVMPLRVKSILTPRRTAIIIVCLFVSLICSIAPMYYANRFQLKFSPERNRTFLDLVFAPDHDFIEQISYTINNLIVPFLAFLVVIVCTAALVINLRSKTKWRQRTITTGQAQAATIRDQKVTKMVVVISTMFILCFLPDCIIFIAMILEPGLSINGTYLNTTMILVGFGFLFVSINSAMNIFFYYHMSSKYRSIFCQLFGLRSKNKAS